MLTQKQPSPDATNRAGSLPQDDVSEDANPIDLVIQPAL